jgi:hypothetical protein
MPDRKLNNLIVSRNVITESTKRSNERQLEKPQLPSTFQDSRIQRSKQEKSFCLQDTCKEKPQTSEQPKRKYQTSQEKPNLKGLPFDLKAIGPKVLQKKLKKNLVLVTNQKSNTVDVESIHPLSSRMSFKTEKVDRVDFTHRFQTASNIDRWETHPSHDETHNEMHDFEEYVRGITKQKV